MTDQTPPSFEDLEPEGEPCTDEGHRSSEYHCYEEDVGAFEEIIMGAEPDNGCDPQGGFFDPELASVDHHPGLHNDRDEFSMKPNPSRSPASLPAVAARNAFQWAARGGSGAGRSGNGQKPGTSPLRPRAGQVCSAALLESHELIQALAVIAARTEDELEAAALASTMVPLVVSLETEAYRALWPSIPVLVRGTMGVVRFLHRRLSTRPYIKLMPEILVQATGRLADHILSGRPASKRLIARTLAQSTGMILTSRLKKQRLDHPPRRSGPRNHDEF